MANLVESQTNGNGLPAAGTNFDQILNGGSGGGGTGTTTVLGNKSALSDGRQQSENPNLRNTSAEFRELQNIGGLTADQTAAGLVTGAVNIIRDDQRLAENIPTIPGGQDFPLLVATPDT